MGVPGHLYGKYKLSWNPHATSAKNTNCLGIPIPFWDKNFDSEPQNLVKNFLIKNLFPKKEKKNYKSSQCVSEAPGPGPGEANNAFSKIFIYKSISIRIDT